MKFPCAVTRKSDGRWSIRHSAPDVGTVEISAASREEAFAKMQDELRFRMEICPCAGQALRNLQIEVIEIPK